MSTPPSTPLGSPFGAPLGEGSPVEPLTFKVLLKYFLSTFGVLLILPLKGRNLLWSKATSPNWSNWNFNRALLGRTFVGFR